MSTPLGDGYIIFAFFAVRCPASDVRRHAWFPLVLLTVYRYAEYRFVLVEKTKSAKNIWEPVFEDVIILGFLMADTSSKQQNIYIFCKI